MYSAQIPWWSMTLRNAACLQGRRASIRQFLRPPSAGSGPGVHNGSQVIDGPGFFLQPTVPEDAEPFGPLAIAEPESFFEKATAMQRVLSVAAAHSVDCSRPGAATEQLRKRTFNVEVTGNRARRHVRRAPRFRLSG